MSTVSLQRVAVVTNIVAPDRLPTLRELARRVPLRVFYSNESELGRQGWGVTERPPFDHEIIGGPAVSLRGRKLYLNPRLLFRLNAFKPAVVVVGGFSLPTLYALVYCAVRDASLVIVSEGTAHSERELGLIRRLVRGGLLRHTSACIAASTEAAKQFESLGASQGSCVVAPYALDMQRRPRRGHAGSAAPARLLSVGQLIGRKGLRELLHAFRQVRSRYDITLTIVGSGPLESEVRSTIARLDLEASVDLLGLVDQPDLPTVYAAHDLFVFPSLDDPFGVVLLEAMAAGLPVLSSSLAGATADFVEPGHNGWIFDPRSAEGFVGALESALAARSSWHKLGAAGRSRIEQASPEYAAEQIMRALSYAGLSNGG